jgi:hypothetical protein
MIFRDLLIRFTIRLVCFFGMGITREIKMATGKSDAIANP